MASSLFPIVLLIAVISLGPLLAFKSVDLANFPGSGLQHKQSGSPQMDHQMKELREQFGAAAQSAAEVGAVKSRVEELSKMVEGSEEAAVKTQEKVKEISERITKFEAKLANADKLKNSVDDVLHTAKTQKIDIAELKASKVNMNAKITNLGTTLGKVSKEMADTKKEIKDELKGIRQMTELIGGGALLEADAALGSEPDGVTAQMKSDDCPSPFTFMEGSGQCLVVSTDKASDMISGSTQCADFNVRGSLAILDTEERLDGAREYLNAEGIHADVLVGGSMASDRYMWVNDKEIDMTKGWCPDQPASGRGCVSLWQGQGFCLDDSHCDYKLYLCEIVPGVEYDYEG